MTKGLLLCCLGGVCLPVVAHTTLRGTLFTDVFEHPIDRSEPIASAASLQYATHKYYLRCEF